MNLKNEALVGMVVVGGLVVLAAGAFFLSGAQWGAQEREIRAAFREVGTLSKGNPVKFRGVTVGRVDDIDLLPTGDGVLVTMTVSDEVVLPPDAGVVVSPESFFGDWQAGIVSRSAVENLEFTVVRGEDVLPGAALPDITQLTAVAADIAEDLQILSDRVQLAFTEETAVKIRETIENVQEVSEQLSGFIDQQTRTYGEVGDNVLAATANIRQMTATAEATATDIREAINEGDLQQITANAALASENLAVFSEQLRVAGEGVPGLVARADTTMAAVSGVVSSLEPQLREVGPMIAEAREAVATLNRAMAAVEQGEGTLGRLVADPALYEETQRAIATLQRLLADLQANPGKYVGEVNVF